jgi:hypothetical protein
MLELEITEKQYKKIVRVKQLTKSRVITNSYDGYVETMDYNPGTMGVGAITVFNNGERNYYVVI